MDSIRHQVNDRAVFHTCHVSPADLFSQGAVRRFLRGVACVSRCGTSDHRDANHCGNGQGKDTDHFERARGLSCHCGAPLFWADERPNAMHNAGVAPVCQAPFSAKSECSA
jgi:hypothetical protein